MPELTLDIMPAPTIGLDLSGGALDLALGIDGGQQNDYEKLVNKPSIEGHVLVGDSLLHQIGVGDITPQDIDRIIYG